MGSYGAIVGLSGATVALPPEAELRLAGKVVAIVLVVAVVVVVVKTVDMRGTVEMNRVPESVVAVAVAVVMVVGNSFVDCFALVDNASSVETFMSGSVVMVVDEVGVEVGVVVCVVVGVEVSVVV